MELFTNFDPFAIREHRRLVHAEIDALRLPTRLRKVRTTAQALRTVPAGAGAWARDREPGRLCDEASRACGKTGEARLA